MVGATASAPDATRSVVPRSVSVVHGISKVVVVLASFEVGAQYRFRGFGIVGPGFGIDICCAAGPATTGGCTPG